MTPSQRDWRDDPVLGTTPMAVVTSLLSDLLTRVRAARDLPDAIDKLKPVDASVFERAWANELFVILDGVHWMFDIVRCALERQARSIGKNPPALPHSFEKPEIDKIEAEIKPARDKLIAHPYGALCGQLTVRDCLERERSISEYRLPHIHEVLERSIDALWKWRDDNADLIKKHISMKDLKRKRGRKNDP